MEEVMKRAFVLFIAVVLVAVPAVSRAEEARTYTVKPGDRPERVAEQFGLTRDELLAANPRAYNFSCDNPRTVTRRDGTLKAICGGRRPYLFAGATLTIPKSRLVLESEKANLNTELTALQAELVQVRQDVETQGQEIEALKQERDRLATANAELAKANTAMAEANNEFASRWSSARAAADANTTKRQAGQAESYETTVIIVVVGSLVVVFLAIVFVFWSRRPLRNLERDRTHLERARQSVVGEAEDLVGRRRTLDDEEQRRRLALIEEEDKQRKLRADLTRWRDELDERNNRALARKREQDEQGTSLGGREAACTTRENAAVRYAVQLDERQRRLDERERELTEKEHAVEALRQFLASQKARQDLKDTEQDQREADLLRGFQDLAAQGQRLQAELDARQKLLDGQEAEINGKIRMYDDDIATAIQRACEELAAREADLARRAGEIGPREEAVAAREKAADAQETDLRLRIESYHEAEAARETRESVLHVDEQELERRQIELANERDGFHQEVAVARAALERETAEARNVLARETQEARAAHAAEVAVAKRTIQQARRKEAIINELDRRRAELDDREVVLQRRERDCDTREGALTAWEARRAALDELPRSPLPRRTTLPPPFGSSPDFPDKRLGDGDDTCEVFPSPPAPPAGQPSLLSGTPAGDAMRFDFSDLPPRDVSKCICGYCSQEFPLGSDEEHAKVCPSQRDRAGQTGPQIPIAAEPSHEESRFYCNTCHQAFSAEEYAANHAEHDGRILPGRTGQA